MSSNAPYRRLGQLRVPLIVADTWYAVTLPVGTIDALLQVEDRTVAFRLSATNTLNPATQGNHAAAGGAFTLSGNATEQVLCYVSASAPTVAVAIYQINP